ncbi:lipocalin-like domain-containing protein [Chitinophaga filiformis]|uniref:Lipocalin-like domain-containing protein n=1 Tax=Chitinophaga filiformis TaxID=104663 RepID=A0A1G8ABX3_CHIFI|nr:lipocalin-like domain-containing protein [Chitinophaga filiformis]SDH18525.1 Lipocalin-like domain-containing protein [Chitinophaga filiformis]
MKKVLLKSILCIMNVILAKPALAQSHQLIGSWRLIAADKILPDGKQVADYGSAPHGIAIFTTDGHYVVEIFGTERMKFATTERGKGTPEEYKNAVLNQSCHFGTYSIDSIKGTITFNIDRGTYPNQDQTLQVRPFTLKGDTLSWRVPARPDGSIPVSVFTRIRTQVPLHHQGVQGVMY